MAWRFYVYEIKRGEDVIYVGKGCRNRGKHSAKERGGSLHIVAYFEHEAAALEFERERIADRLHEGCKLKNIKHGNEISWWRRSDSRQMALEVLEDVARKFGTWIKAGRIKDLSKRVGMTEGQILFIHQEYGR